MKKVDKQCLLDTPRTVRISEKLDKLYTPASNLGYLAPPPGQFFMGAKLFIGTPWMGNEGVLKKILVWAM